MQLCQEIARFVGVFADVQQALLDAMLQKRQALVAADPVRLSELNTREQSLISRLETLLVWRSRLLKSADSLGRPGETLTEVLSSLEDAEAAGLLARLAELQQISLALRQEAWIQWVISQSCSLHYGEMFDLIAHRGQAAPTYEERPAATSNGGAVLDAAV